MNRLKIVGAGLVAAGVAAGGLTKAEWLLIISMLITLLGMLQEYLNKDP